MIFKPWNKDIEEIFMRISRTGKAYTFDPKLTQTIGRMHPELKDYIEIFRKEEIGKSIIAPMDDVKVVPKPIRTRNKVRLFEIYRLF